MVGMWMVDLPQQDSSCVSSGYRLGYRCHRLEPAAAEPAAARDFPDCWYATTFAATLLSRACQWNNIAKHVMCDIRLKTALRCLLKIRFEVMRRIKRPAALVPVKSSSLGILLLTRRTALFLYDHYDKATRCVSFSVAATCSCTHLHFSDDVEYAMDVVQVYLCMPTSCTATHKRRARL